MKPILGPLLFINLFIAGFKFDIIFMRLNHI